MARKSGRPGPEGLAGAKKSGGSGLAWVMAAVVVLAVLVTAAVPVLVARTEGSRAAAIEAAEELASTQAVQTVLQQQRYLRLNLISRIFATDQVLASYLTEAAQKRDEEAILASVEEYQNLLTFDLAVVLDRSGMVLERTDDRSAEGEDLSSTPLVEVALEESKASGVWRQGNQLYHAVAVPLVREFDLVGYIAVAYAIDNSLATQIQRTGGADVVFLADAGTGPSPTVSTLSADRATELVEALRRAGDVFQRVMERGETVQDVPLELGGASWTASLSPLRDAGGSSVGAVVALTSMADKLGAADRVTVAALGAGALALVVGAALVLLLAQRLQAPFRRVADAAVEGAQGHYEVALPSVGGDAGRVSDALRALFGRLREKAAAEYVALRVARLLPEPAKAASRAKAEAATACVLGVDMRRYADPKLGYDPEENLGRLARDIQRVTTSAASQQGRMLSVQGHRALLLFEGEQATWRAFSAAAEILLTLAQRENAFDEAKPPVVALSSGPMVLGSLPVGEQTTGAAAGLPVVFLDALMREAAAGYLYFTKQVYAELAQIFQRGQAEVKGQRSALGSKQPLYLVDTDTAARLTGAKPLAGDGEEGGGETRTLADLRPGTVLANRFEFLAELGAGRQGVVWKAQDRQMGDLVTLKMLRPEMVQDASNFERLKRAVAKSRSIRHPNVLSVLDFGAAEQMPFIEAEFVRGMTLAYVLEQANAVPVVAGVRIARQIAYALAAAHGQQLMHGSLKPSNVLLEVAGEVRVMDFGLGVPVRAGQAVTGAAYLAPEQLSGQDPDSRADFWAYGVIIYQSLTGKMPFPGTSVEEIRQRIAQQEPAVPTSLVPEIPAALEKVILRCLGKSPDQRYSSADELLAAIEDVEI